RGFRLLGKRGTWQRETVCNGDGTALLHVDGWSYLQKRNNANPMGGYLCVPDDDLPIVGMVHADLDEAKSVYLPVMLADLVRHQVDLWLLGHIHAPRHIAGDGGPHVLYPGSPLA